MKKMFNFAFEVFVWICVALGVVCMVVGIAITNAIKTYHGKENPNNTDKNIETLTKDRDSIKIVVNSLDSIKNAKIIEVEALDADSAVKLFYELISE